MASRRDLDEDDVRTRPARSTRPRTKDRPDYTFAARALVIAVDRGRTTCVLEDSETVVVAMKSRELGKKSVVVGDIVGLVGDISGTEGSLARIVSVIPRKNALTRTIDDNPGEERMIVANVDQMAIVIAAANPEPRHGFVDRALVVAFDQGIKPIIILTKRDLADGKEFLSVYNGLDIDLFEIQRGGDLSLLRAALSNKMSVLLGHSGVGKSTLVNALVESADRSTGIVNDVTGRGRHTSSSALALRLDPMSSEAESGWIIDTPGVRSFGVAHVNTERVIASFPEFAEVMHSCPKNCSHIEEGCALNNWEGFDATLTSRLNSLRRLLSAQ